MKRYLFIIAGFAMALTSCQKGEGDGAVESDSFTITASICETKADDGSTIYANRCIMQVFDSSGEVKETIYKALDDGSVSFSYSSSELDDYTCVFWADYVQSTASLETDKYYATDNTGGLSNVSVITPRNLNDPKIEVFTGRVSVSAGSVVPSVVELKRAQSKVTINSGLKDVDVADYPKEVKIKYTDVGGTTNYSSRGYNALTGAVIATEESRDVAYEFQSGDFPVNGFVIVDYIFSSSLRERLDTEIMFCYDNGVSFTNECANVSYRANYHTIISGELLTYGEVSVTISPTIAN